MADAVSVAAPITVAPGETATHTLQFSVPRLTIRVRVGGQALRGRDVACSDERAPFAGDLARASLWPLGKTDADGRVRFPRLQPPPALRLWVHGDRQLYGPFAWPAGSDELVVDLPAR